MLTAERLRARAILASKTAYANRRPHDPAAGAAVVEARQAFKAISAEEYVRQLVDSAPTLTPDQLSRLAALLRPADGAASC